ncbi:MAG TPA: DUF6268 family outer membrane beta-barrel protein [Salinimicrobium sp.]|nr:DUF6268 family outer membrane beta-barrel protein [Salinimicrobium sp.]
MKKIFQSIILIIGLQVCGQSDDLARLEYTYFPQSSSDNSFRRFVALINFPVKVKENEDEEGIDSYLIPGIEYENINFKFEDPAPVGGIPDLDRYQSFTTSLGYLTPLKKNWILGIQGGVKIASNFELGEIINDDLIYTGAVFFIKSSEEEAPKPWRLILGLHYTTTSGIPFPLPVINYHREFHPDWTFTLGVPKSNIKYFFNKKNVVQAFVTLDGFFANIQSNRPFLNNANKVAENISMTIVLGGLGYEHNFTDHLVYYLYAGHTIMNDIRFRDGNLDNVYDINKTNTFYMRSGIKFQF